MLLRWWRARPLQPLLNLAVIAAGVALVLAMQITLIGLDHQADQVAAQRAGGSTLDVRATAGAGLSAAQLGRVAGLPGVAAVSPLQEKRVIARIDPNSIVGLTATVVVLRDGGVAMRPLQLRSGRLPRPDSLDEVAVDDGMAAALQATGGGGPVRVGASVRLTTETGPDRFRVVGIGTEGSGAAGASFSRSAVYITSREAANTFSLGLRTPLVALRAKAGLGAATLASGVEQTLGPAAIAVDPGRDRQTPLGDLRPLVALLVTLAILVGAGVGAGGVALSLEERRRDLGLLRVAGASRRQVRRLLLCEASVIAAAGSVIGILLGMLVAAQVDAHYLAAGLAGPPWYGGGRAVLLALAVGIGMAAIGSVPLVLRAAAMPPLTALRSADSATPRHLPGWTVLVAAALAAFGLASLTSSSRSLLSAGAGALLLGLVVAVPAAVPRLARAMAGATRWTADSVQLAAANLARRGPRTTLTIGGLSLAVAVAVAASSLVLAALGAGDRWVGTLFPGDGVVTSPATQPELVAQQLERTAGVGETGMVRFFNLDLAGRGVGFAAIDPGVYLRHGGLRFSAGDRLTALELLDSAPSLVVPEDLAAAYGWRFGDHLSLPTVDGISDAIVVGVVEHSFPAGDGRESVLMGRNVARHLFGPLAAGFDDLVVAGGGGADGALRAAVAGYGMQLVRVDTIRDSADAAVAHSVGLLVAVAVVTVLLAVLAVVTTLLVNIRQGMRDLGLLRAVGLSRRRARQLIRAEALLLALTGTVAGIAGGTLVALPMTRVIAGPGFAPEFTFPAAAALAAGLAILAIALMAAALPSRRVTSTSIVAAVRYD